MPGGKPSVSAEKIIDFLEKNVIGKTVYSEEVLYDIDFGRFEGSYSTEIAFSNLLRSETGFTMGGFTVSREKIFGPGDPTTLVKDQRLISFFQYEFSKRTSTGEITGLLRFVSSSVASIPSHAEATTSSIFGVTIKDNELRWVEDQILYREQQNADGTYSPKAFISERYLKMRGGKLEHGFSAECYVVDPRTLERKKAFEYYSPFIARER
ncbi:hypothetical protein Mpt1_c11060 [Candidatus Methanoplasma termitum]|uniref:Uncharacterized protein n=1 Tax=Candidatus Methanoplasma termitum TaxID=1577791 RepID=A0A0A7LD91_9ARCH|nr:hypothetical protein [Candidatus Methanoplasma termitum]AIZ56973.1 hypothetical protein Mpt1_c11060 [Candidatus Methanoplasma termitum]MCL2333287.1 hypothetical protein [Candidatus Methanoplasma sp.]